MNAVQIAEALVGQAGPAVSAFAAAARRRRAARQLRRRHRGRRPGRHDGRHLRLARPPQHRRARAQHGRRHHGGHRAHRELPGLSRGHHRLRARREDEAAGLPVRRRPARDRRRRVARAARRRRLAVVTDEATVTARAVILSPGVEARKLGVPGEAEFMGRGVSYCATCDGPLYRDKEVVVIGGGNAAVEEGMFLARFASTVHVVHRRDALRATAIAQERAFAQPNMHFIWNGQVRRIVGETKVEGVEYEDVLDHTHAHAARVGRVLLRRPAPPDRVSARHGRAGRRRLHRDRRPPAHRPPRRVCLRRRARRHHQADRQRRGRGRPGGDRRREVPGELDFAARQAAPARRPRRRSRPRRRLARTAPLTASADQAPDESLGGTRGRSDAGHLQGGGTRRSRQGPGRLLGRVVRTVPRGRAGAERDRRAQSRRAVRQAQRRREPAGGAEPRGAEHPDAARLSRAVR